MASEQSQGIEVEATDELLTLDEAIKFLDTSKSTLYRLLSQEDLKGVKVGKQWRFRKADLMAYLERGPVAVAVDAAARLDLDAELDFFAEAWLAAGQDPTELTSRHEGASSFRIGWPNVKTGAALTEGISPEDKIVALANRILLLGVVGSVSDIHLETSESSLRLRYRIDGVLHDIRRMPMSLHESLLAHFKGIAEMNLAEKRVPQDGRFPIRHAEKEYELKMSVLPTLYGENAVMRILDRSLALIGLEKLGMSAAELETLRSWMHRPSGLILATGPSGHGKTTLLYSFLQETDAAKYKVLSIEDPVEYRITDITQVQVNKKAGLTFSTALRSFLRQDADIILCGELRDLETAALLVEASLTGHLVLSSLHTEDAPTAILRLADMGVERYLVAATLTGIVARRLARRLCPHCKTITPPEESALLVERVRRMTEHGGYHIPDGADFYTAVGCDLCHGTGYQGRLGLFEILTCTPKLVGQLLQCDSHEEMTRLAVNAGMRTLLADGMRKAVDGETSIDEVLRATGTWL